MARSTIRHPCFSVIVDISKRASCPELTASAVMQGKAMIRHIVIFRFKPDASQASKSELVSNLEALFDSIPAVQAFESGTNISKEGLDEGFSHVFLLTFKDEAGRDNYVEHAEHRRFVKENLTYVDSVLALDYDNTGAKER